ncbi:hypothetical protein G7Y89_g12862 [Cudoniella acicularis]|uniref:Uncharacterized protein n=1 Tax=Cudoniella acicularis TaxID=354080 RepID=A0A8H4VYS2_9HELO|nr:hypothetical protein G7Y89_g12862 [Cudoniella acicularis]
MCQLAIYEFVCIHPGIGFKQLLTCAIIENNIPDDGDDTYKPPHQTETKIPIREGELVSVEDLVDILTLEAKKLKKQGKILDLIEEKREMEMLGLDRSVEELPNFKGPPRCYLDWEKY